MSTRERIHEATWMRGAYDVSPNMRGHARQRISAFLNQQPKSLGQIHRTHTDYVRSLYERGAALHNDAPASVGLARTASLTRMAWQVFGAALARFTCWALFSRSIIRNLISWAVLAAGIVYLTR